MRGAAAWGRTKARHLNSSPHVAIGIQSSREVYVPASDGIENPWSLPRNTSLLADMSRAKL